MPTDLRIDKKTLDIGFDSGNDIATISGVRQLEQSIALDALDETRRLVGGKITGENIGLLEERIERSLKNDEQVESVQKVSVEEYDRVDNSVLVEVRLLENEDFNIELTV